MSMTLNQVSKLTEEEARALLERIRWPNGPVCPHCGSVEATKLQGKVHRAGLYDCHGCQVQFTATVKTIMEDSHLPIRTWLMAFAILCSAKKGVSALQLQRQLELGSYRTAWHLCHRIRHAMGKEPMVGLLKGTVEVDETYVGGKPRKGTGNTRMGRGTKKVPVVALVERGGKVRAWPIENVMAATLKGAVRDHVERSATIMTDEYGSYRGLSKEFASHQMVSHSRGEYARRRFIGHNEDKTEFYFENVHTNTVEGYFALLKRGVMGSFHHVSKKHLGRYVDEFSFRWNHRETTDGERTEEAIKGAEGKRLMYRDPIKQ
jgi:transposase-like protein